MKKTLIALLAVAAMACAQKETTIEDTAVTETNQTATPAATEPAPPATTADFATNAAADGMMEVRLGELAREKAQASEVKDFAAMMVTDHTKSNDEMIALASTKNIAIPAELPEEKKQIVDRLSGLSGAEFDREYMRAMVDDHQKAVDMFTQASNATDVDAELKAFATKTLPALQQHLERARTISGNLK